MKTNLNELSKEVYHRNIEKVFWDGGIEAKNFGEVISLMHSELSEALEAHRKDHYANKVEMPTVLISGGVDAIASSKNRFIDSFEANIKNSLEDEMADIVIRVMDYCGAANIDIDWHIEQKMKYNLLRPHKHGKNY